MGEGFRIQGAEGNTAIETVCVFFASKGFQPEFFYRGWKQLLRHNAFLNLASHYTQRLDLFHLPPFNFQLKGFCFSILR